MIRKLRSLNSTRTFFCNDFRKKLGFSPFHRKLCSKTDTKTVDGFSLKFPGYFKIGEHVELEIESVGNLGVTIARGEGCVFFVKNAIPGEKVVAKVTKIAKNYVRADAIKVIRASKDRISPPCKHALTCGGCDFQYITLERQRLMKAEVIKEQFRRIAMIDVGNIEVEPADSSNGIGYRSRMTYSVDFNGKLGLMQSRSNKIIPLNECVISHPKMNLPYLTQKNWGAVKDKKRKLVSDKEPKIEIAISSSTGERTIALDKKIVNGPQIIHEKVLDQTYKVSMSSFWQGHMKAPEVLGAFIYF